MAASPILLIFSTLLFSQLIISPAEASRALGTNVIDLGVKECGELAVNWTNERTKKYRPDLSADYPLTFIEVVNSSHSLDAKGNVVYNLTIRAKNRRGIDTRIEAELYSGIVVSTIVSPWA
ncbi:hypothetical protein HPP92_000563 [Vanilla planifolia]|uniref:Uncharacterized protein n=1 Tax=Vanilla planifolia TaxID=51239 RepID=A0A835S5Y5_VANPL|nr:hypothetical protein HPP92_000563 [Vanilla planifolia]